MTLPPLVEPAADLTVDEVKRYSRHLIIPDVGMTGQKRLKNAKVLCVGAVRAVGAVGAVVALNDDGDFGRPDGGRFALR